MCQQTCSHRCSRRDWRNRPHWSHRTDRPHWSYRTDRPHWSYRSHRPCRRCWRRWCYRRCRPQPGSWRHNYRSRRQRSGSRRPRRRESRCLILYNSQRRQRRSGRHWRYRPNRSDWTHWSDGPDWSHWPDWSHRFDWLHRSDRPHRPDWSHRFDWFHRPDWSHRSDRPLLRSNYTGIAGDHQGRTANFRRQYAVVVRFQSSEVRHFDFSCNRVVKCCHQLAWHLPGQLPRNHVDSWLYGFTRQRPSSPHSQRYKRGRRYCYAHLCRRRSGKSGLYHPCGRKICTDYVVCSRPRARNYLQQRRVDCSEDRRRAHAVIKTGPPCAAPFFRRYYVSHLCIRHL